MSKFFQNIFTRNQPVVAECFALLKAMEFCQEMGFYFVEFEDDAQIVVQAIRKEEEYCAWFGTMIEEAKQVFKANGLWSMNFIHKEGNRAAHTLDKFGFSFIDDNVKIEEISSVLIPIVTSELIK